MIVDIERPQWPTARAVEVASVDPKNPPPIKIWRSLYGFACGKFMGGKAGGVLYSTLDVGELGVACLLRKVGVPVAVAIKQASRERQKLKTVLTARLEYGYWPLAAVIFETPGPVHTSRAFSLGELCERLIAKLELPLRVFDVMPRKAEAALIVAVVAKYVGSDEFVRRCDKLRKEVLARERPTDWREVSVRTGVPLWIIREGAKGVAEEADHAAEGDGPPISIVHVLRDRLGVTIEAAP